MLGKKISKEEAETLIHHYVSKSLRINKNCVRAYTTLANLNELNGNYEKAEEQFEKAIKINPNDATAHHHFSFFNGYKPNPDLEKYFYHIDKAYELNPFSMPISSTYIAALNATNKPKQAMQVFNNKKFLFPNRLKTNLLANINLYLNKDWKAFLAIYETALKDDPNNVETLLQLARYYWNISNDADNYLKYSQRAYELNPKRAAYDYFWALICSKNFKTAKGLLSNIDFTNNINDVNGYILVELTGYYHYFTGAYEMALKYFNKSSNPDVIGFLSIPGKRLIHYKALALAKLKKHDEAIKFMRDHIKSNEGMALIFASLKEKDSMYYYLDKIDDIFVAKYTNGDIEFNPYRKEERYKTFLKKHYLPLTHWNE